MKQITNLTTRVFVLLAFLSGFFYNIIQNVLFKPDFFNRLFIKTKLSAVEIKLLKCIFQE